MSHSSMTYLELYTLSGALSSLLNSMLGILLSLFSSVLAVFQAILALGAELARSSFILVKMVMELGQGLLTFVTVNFVTILIIGGLYVAYTQYGAPGRGRRNLKIRR